MNIFFHKNIISRSLFDIIHNILNKLYIVVDFHHNFAKSITHRPTI